MGLSTAAGSASCPPAVFPGLRLGIGEGGPWKVSGPPPHPAADATCHAEVIRHEVRAPTSEKHDARRPNRALIEPLSL